jgi:F-box protein 11
MSSPNHLLGTVIDGRYRLREFIGSGSYGSVFAADELTLGRVISQVAVKLITPEGDDQHKTVMLEILGLAQLNHDYIITYRSSGEVREGPLAGSIFLATELGDTTLSRLVKNAERISDEEFRDLIRGVTTALAHIHKAGVIHGDVKPANLIRVKGRWKLGDLGLMKSTRRKPTGPAFGSLTYMAPEMLRHEFAPASDIYALGATILWYFTGKYPHDADTKDEFIALLKTRDANVPDYIREPWRTLATRCLSRDPLQRPTAEQIQATVGPTSPHFPFLDSDRAAVVVAQNGKGHYTSLAEAIAGAPSGARIFVHPGRYRESLRIDKSLEIIGDGKPDDIVISTRDGHCLEIATTKPVMIRGLTFRSKPGPDGFEAYTVDIGQGRPLLKDCLIQSQSLACVAIHDNGEPTLRRCQMFGSRDAGVFIYDGGRGTFEACDIFSNGSTGIAVSDRGEATLRRCKIYDNHTSGAAVFPGGMATFEECQILTNGKSGATIAGRGVFRGCAITRNAAEALVLKGRGRVVVTGCDLRNNVGGAWRLSDECEREHMDNQE